jgi:hypothetical protein
MLSTRWIVVDRYFIQYVTTRHEASRRHHDMVCIATALTGATTGAAQTLVLSESGRTHGLTSLILGDPQGAPTSSRPHHPPPRHMPGIGLEKLGFVESGELHLRGAGGGSLIESSMALLPSRKHCVFLVDSSRGSDAHVACQIRDQAMGGVPGTVSASLIAGEGNPAGSAKCRIYLSCGSPGLPTQLGSPHPTHTSFPGPSSLGSSS